MITTLSSVTHHNGKRSWRGAVLSHRLRSPHATISVFRRDEAGIGRRVMHAEFSEPGGLYEFRDLLRSTGHERTAQVFEATADSLEAAIEAEAEVTA